MFEERYKKLNQNQRDAVDTIFGPVLVVAGPGSGKTELLSIRVANILKKTDTNPSNILLLTFTDSASYNMRERLINLMGAEAYKIGIYTFHSFANDILTRYQEYFFKNVKFTAGTELDQINILENILKKLPKKNPLGIYHPEQGYIYLKDILGKIKDLKKGNLNPDEFADKIKQNKKFYKELVNTFEILEEVTGKRKYSEVIPVYVNIFTELEKLSKKNEIANFLYNSLGNAIKKASEEEKTSELTSWKNEYTKKDDSGKIILADSDEKKQEKLEYLIDVYKEYQEQLEKNSLYDFEDMILLVAKGIKENVSLQADLQEKYQYIMMDEFQDTNISQFQLVLNILANSLNNNTPNILAVGDDDQAIYKFQGAQLENIYSFINSFENVKVITLDKNYRSTPEVLDISKNVITQAKTRLSSYDKNVQKNISSGNTELIDKKIGSIETKKFENEILEYDFIANKIKKLIEENVEPKEISVICRKHDQLKKLANTLNSFKIPYSYEKKENVLEKEHINEIINILKFINNTDDESLLPTILSYNFFGLERINVWKIAVQVKNNSDKKISWLECMHESSDTKIQNIAKFLIELSIDAKSTPLEYIIDKIVGTTEYLWGENEDAADFKLNTESQEKTKNQKFTSPYREYYFNNQNFIHNRTTYLDFLFSLRTFIAALRDFKKEEVLYTKDIIDFLNIYSGNNLTLSVTSPFSTSKNAVSLLTAHKAKGMEFEYVFLLNASQDIWGKNNRSSKITFPINLNLSADKDNDDDKIRLLYVALTRAKHTLYITHSNHKIEFLVDENETKNYKENMVEVTDETISSLNIVPKNIYVEDEKILLHRLLENYKMPITHLNNFLNFTRVGPGKFLEQNLLRFPQAITSYSAYGSAMHYTIERYFLNDKNYLDNFEKSLLKFRLPEIEYKKFLDEGIDNLEIYIKYLEKRKIIPNTKVEVKFNNEGVCIQDVQATGNIDRIEIINDEIIVTDLKTGDSFDTWENTQNKKMDDGDKIKLHFYKYQLIYYKLLIENSNTYKNYKVRVGNLEFLEADRNGKIIVLPYSFENEEAIVLKARLEKLANIIYKKILNLDFPDTSKYSNTLSGIIKFEDDLLNEEI